MPSKMPFSEKKYNSAVKIFLSFFSKIFFQNFISPVHLGMVTGSGRGFGPWATASAMMGGG